VSTFRLEPEHFILTTGTFNLIVKDRIAFRLSGALSVRTEPLAGSRTSSKPFNRIVSRKSCQPFAITGFPPVLHNGELPSGQEKLKRGELFVTTTRRRSSACNGRAYSAHAEAEDGQI